VAVTEYVLGRRTPEGGYCYYRTPGWGVEEPNAPDTLAALECLRILGIKPPGPVATGDWLRGLQADDGGYATLTIGWAALRALDVLGLARGRSPEAWLERWAGQLLGWHGPREWRGALGDVLHLLELLGLAGRDLSSDERDRLAGMLDAGSDERGGWARPGGDLETTAVAVRVIELAGLPRARWGAAAGFLRRCESEALGLVLAPGAGMTSAGALWGGLKLARAAGVGLRHPGAIAASLALLQRPDGGLGARHWAISTLRDTWLGLQAARVLEELQEE
jgi:Prenyltransferase and squalene oxidase repeat